MFFIFISAIIKTDSNESLDHRGGGGAPIRDSNGKTVTLLSNKWKEEELVIHN